MPVPLFPAFVVARLEKNFQAPPHTTFVHIDKCQASNLLLKRLAKMFGGENHIDLKYSLVTL